MNKITAVLSLLSISLMVTGCETMQPASYSNYGDNTFALRKYDGTKVRVGSMTDLSNFNSGCRLVGPIKTAGNRPISEFIQDSFNDELKFAGEYSNDPSAVNLKATLNSASFSSMTDLTQGYWSFSLQLSNPDNGKSLTENSKYGFDSGFDAATACSNTSNALTPAVQRLINKFVSDPGYPSLIGYMPNAQPANAQPASDQPAASQ